jgi:hypothetical protein
MNNKKIKMPALNIAERSLVKCYYLNGVTYVPHIKYAGFAYPAITKNDLPVTSLELMNAGAKLVEEWMYTSTNNAKK